MVDHFQRGGSVPMLQEKEHLKTCPFIANVFMESREFHQRYFILNISDLSDGGF